MKEALDQNRIKTRTANEQEPETILQQKKPNIEPSSKKKLMLEVRPKKAPK
jgi:hypothetical protein